MSRKFTVMLGTWLYPDQETVAGLLGEVMEPYLKARLYTGGQELVETMTMAPSMTSLYVKLVMATPGALAPSKWPLVRPVGVSTTCAGVMRGPPVTWMLSVVTFTISFAEMLSVFSSITGCCPNPYTTNVCPLEYPAAPITMSSAPSPLMSPARDRD
jgi:hypothetical protein